MTPNQEQLVYWINERESIRKKKEAGEAAPWSDNTVMQDTYFCNVNREDDTVTKWIRNNWVYDSRFPNEDNFLVLAMTAARLFNLPSTLEEIGQPHSFGYADWIENLSDVIYDRRDRGDNVWNGAYIVSTNGKKMDKGKYCIEVLKNVKELHIPFSRSMHSRKSTLQYTHELLIDINGIGNFIGAQIIADLKNTKGHPLHHAPDWWSFSAPGPGSLRGLEWFFNEKVTNKNYKARILEAESILEWELPDEILHILCQQNLQNCFCEYDKFMRVTNGTGRSKRKYNGKGK